MAGRPVTSARRGCALLVAAVATVAFSCSSTDAGKEATTPTSIGDPLVADQIAGLGGHLISSSDLPGNFGQLAEVTFGDFTLCDRDLLEANEPAGRLAVAYGTPEENLLVENVLVYRESSDATAFMEDFGEEAARCAEEAADSTLVVTPIEAPGIGDMSAAVQIAGTDSGGRGFSGELIAAQNQSVVVLMNAVNLEEPHIESGFLEEITDTAVTKIRPWSRNS